MYSNCSVRVQTHKGLHCGENVSRREETELKVQLEESTIQGRKRPGRKVPVTALIALIARALIGV